MACLSMMSLFVHNIWWWLVIGNYKNCNILWWIVIGNYKNCLWTKKVEGPFLCKPENFESNDTDEFVLFVVTNMTHLFSLNLYELGIRGIASAIENWNIYSLLIFLMPTLRNYLVLSLGSTTCMCMTLKHCPKLVKFPEGMRNMVSLRQLDIWGSSNIEMPLDLGRLLI